MLPSIKTKNVTFLTMSGMKYWEKAVTIKDPKSSAIRFMFRTSFSPFWNIVFYLVVGTSSVTFTYLESSQKSVQHSMTYNACRGSTAQRQSLSQTARMTELAKADTVVFPYPKDYRAVAATFTVVK